jgi:hypothetical protein
MHLIIATKGPLSNPTMAVQACRWELVFHVKGFWDACPSLTVQRALRAGVGKASGEETARGVRADGGGQLGEGGLVGGKNSSRPAWYAAISFSRNRRADA